MTILSDKYGNGQVVEFSGRMSMKNRIAALNAFKGDARLLIANKTCAGYGLNLQYCHCAIYYDNDWNWGTRIQSEDRLHRIGQANGVIIVDVCSDSFIDNRILDCLDRKENLADNFKSYVRKNMALNWLIPKRK